MELKSNNFTFKKCKGYIIIDKEPKNSLLRIKHSCGIVDDILQKKIANFYNLYSDIMHIKFNILGNFPYVLLNIYYAIKQ